MSGSFRLLAARAAPLPHLTLYRQLSLNLSMTLHPTFCATPPLGAVPALFNPTAAPQARNQLLTFIVA